MERQEALELFKNVEKVFKNHKDMFGYVSKVYDPIKAFSNGNDLDVEETSKSFHLDFLNGEIPYTLSYTQGTTKLINTSEEMNPKTVVVNSFSDIINVLEKEDENGTNE